MTPGIVGVSICVTVALCVTPTAYRQFATAPIRSLSAFDSYVPLKKKGIYIIENLIQQT